MQTYFVTFLQGLKHFSNIFIKHIFHLEPIFFSFMKKTYILDHAASFNMHMQKFKSPQKTVFALRPGGGGTQMLQTGP